MSTLGCNNVDQGSRNVWDKQKCEVLVLRQYAGLEIQLLSGRKSRWVGSLRLKKDLVLFREILGAACTRFCQFS